MEPYTRNGSIIGKTMDFASTETYGVEGQPLGLSDSLLTLTGPRGSWDQRFVDLSAYAGHEIKLVWKVTIGTTNNVYENDVQIDSISVDGNSYTFESSTEGFETSTSGGTSIYTSVSFSALGTGTTGERWNRDSGGTPSAGTGFTTGAESSTWYVYTESSSPTQNGDNFWLRSPTITLSSSPGNLSFYEARSISGATTTIDVYVDVISAPSGGGGSNNKKNSGIWDLQAVFESIEPDLGPPVTSSFINQYLATNSSTSYNFSTSTLTASLVVVSVHNETNTGTAIPATSVTIGGVSATEAVGISSNNSGGATYSGIWYAVISSSTTSISVSYGSSPLRMGIGVYTITGYNSTSPVFTGSDGDTVATSTRTVNTSSIASGAAIIAAHTSGDIYAHTWSGVTERYDTGINNFTGMTGASLVTSSSQTHTISCTTDTTPSQGTALAVAAWR